MKRVYEIQEWFSINYSKRYPTTYRPCYRYLEENDMRRLNYRLGRVKFLLTFQDAEKWIKENPYCGIEVKKIPIIGKCLFYDVNPNEKITVCLEKAFVIMKTYCTFMPVHDELVNSIAQYLSEEDYYDYMKNSKKDVDFF